jgi:hypothetical protein
MKKILIAAVAVVAFSAPTFAATVYVSATGRTADVDTEWMHNMAPSTVKAADTSTWLSIGAGASNSRTTHGPDHSKIPLAKSLVKESDASTWPVVGAGAVNTTKLMGH